MGFLQDVRYGIRLMGRNPAFAFAAILTLAIGIGANTAMFNVVYSVLFRPLPYSQPDRLAVLLENGNGPVAPFTYFEWKRNLQGTSMLAATEANSATLQDNDGAELVRGMRATQELASLLGVKPALGQWYANERDVVVLSHGLWLRRFGGDKNVIGRTIRMNGEPVTVIAVMPQEFYFSPFWVKADYWTPLVIAARANNRTIQTLRVFARLKDGVSVARVQSEVAAIDARLRSEYPDDYRRLATRSISLRDKTTGPIQNLLFVLFGAVACLLLLASANVTSLLLGRGAARRHEFAIRASIGGDQKRLLRQSMTETLLLALCGGAAGCLLAVWVVDGLPKWLPAGAIPRQTELGVNWTMIAASFVFALLAAVIAGLLPGWQSARVDLNEVLKTVSRGGSGRATTRPMLVAAEAAFALVLLCGAGLFVRSFVALRAIDPGFDPNGVLTMSVSLSGTPHAQSPQSRLAFYRQVADGLRAMPGVSSVGVVNHLPLNGDEWGLSLLAEGDQESDRTRAVYRVVEPGYFNAMRIDLRNGRDFNSFDRQDTQPVIIVNQAFARAKWPNIEAIGKRLRMGREGAWMSVVGVVADARQSEWSAPVQPEIYVPLAQNADYLGGAGPAFSYMTFVIRSAGDVSAGARQVVRSIERNAPVSQLALMTEVIGEELWRERVSMMLVGGFAVLALLLAATGIAAMVAQSISERTQELGIRVAMGASPRDLIALVLRTGLIPVAAGCAVGIVLVLAAGQFTRTLFYGVRPWDIATLLTATAVLLTAALVSLIAPARKAAGVKFRL